MLTLFRTRMTFDTLLVVFLLALTTKTYRIIETEDSYHLIKTFLIDTAPEEQNYKLEAIVTNLDDDCNGLIDWYIKNLLRVSVIIANEKYFTSTPNLSKTNSVLVFVESLVKFEEILDNINYYEFINFNGNFKIIFCNSFNAKYLNFTFKLLRRNYILNFVLVYYYRHVLNVFSFNQFNETVLNFTDSYRTLDIFPNKLDNLYGYELKISICDDYPRNIYRNGSIKGSDLSLLKSIVNHINATVKYIVHDNFTGIIDDMRNFKTDFSFIGYFASHKIQGITFTHPQYMDNIIVLVPDKGPIPLYLNILIVFDVRYLPALIIPSISVLIMLYLIRKFVLKKSSFIEAYMDVTSLQFNVPVKNFERSKLPIKFLLISWIIHSVIINAVYESALITAYVTPKKYKNINSLEELEESKLKIHVPRDYGVLVSNDSLIKDQLIYDSMKNVTKNLINNNINYAYALPSSYALEALVVAYEDAKLKKKLRQFLNKPRFWTLKDVLVPSHKVYLFPTKSIYMEKINKMILIDREQVLTNIINNERHRVRHRRKYYLNNNLTVLTIWHMQMSFYLLMFGLILATLTFAIEGIVHNYTKR